MEFLVIGHDAAAFDGGDHELHERHQTYMDSWSSHFVARGPVLSDDGGHAGSVHIVRAADLATARRFAFDEPYARAGWYADVAVSPYVSCVEGTMWDRPVTSAGAPSTLVRATWSPQPHDARLVARLVELLAPQQPAWLFAGLELDDEASRSVGFTAGVDLSQREAADRATTLLTAATPWPCEVSTDRWRRGGRH